MPMIQNLPSASPAPPAAERGNGAPSARDEDSPRFSDMLREQRSAQCDRGADRGGAAAADKRDPGRQAGASDTGAGDSAAEAADQVADPNAASAADATATAPDAMALLAAMMESAQTSARRPMPPSDDSRGSGERAVVQARDDGARSVAGDVANPLAADAAATDGVATGPRESLPAARQTAARGATPDFRDAMAATDPARTGAAATPAARRPDDLAAAADPRGPATGQQGDPNALAGTSLPPAFAMREPQGAQHAANMPAVNVDAPVGSRDFTEQTAQQVTWLARNGVEQAEIRIKPAELGPIAVRIEMNQNEAVISFAVTQPETRAAVQDALHKLTEMLAENGIALGQANVGGQELAGQSGFAQPGSRNRVSFGAAAPESAVGAPAPAAPRARGGVGVVDTFA